MSPLTQEQYDKYIRIRDGDMWTETTHCFYAKIHDGKVTVPKQIMEDLELEDDDFAKLEIMMA